MQTRPINYAKYTPSMSLPEYKERLGKSQGTHVSAPCGERTGSFLACYLQDRVVNGNDHFDGLFLEIDALIKQDKCVIAFNKEHQLPALFDRLKDKLPLYFQLLSKSYVSADLQCQDGSTFLHVFLKNLNILNLEQLAMATQLVMFSQAALPLLSQSEYPLTVILKKVMSASSPLSPDHNTAMLKLLSAFVLPEKKAAQDEHIEPLIALLRQSFDLFSGSRERALLGFDMVIAAASLGAPLHQPLKDFLDGKTSAFAQLMQLDCLHEWGRDNMRRLLGVASKKVVKDFVQTNAFDVDLVRLADVEPNDPQSYIYLDSVTPEKDFDINRSDCIYSRASGVYKYTKDLTNWLVPRLENLAKFYDVGKVVAYWANFTNSPSFYSESRFFGIEPERQHNLMRDIAIDISYLNQAIKKKIDHDFLGKVLYKENQISEYFLEYHRPIGNRDDVKETYSKYISEYYHPTEYHRPIENRDNSKEGFSDANRLVLKQITIPSFSPSHSFVQTISDSSLIKKLREDDKKSASVFSIIGEVFAEPQWVSVCQYYYAYALRPRGEAIRKNALMAYLEKGCVVQAGTHSSDMCVSFKRDFKFVNKKNSRLIRDVKAAPNFVAVYECNQTKEKMVRYGDEVGDVVQRHYIYDLTMLKQFKDLGFDFSSSEVTAWIASFLPSQALSPALFQLLATMKKYGAVFPEKIGEVTYPDFIIGQLQACKEKHPGFMAQLKSLAATHEGEATVQAHLELLGLKGEMTDKAYQTAFEEAWLTLNKPATDYLGIFNQWLDTFEEGVDRGSKAAFGNLELLMKSLRAYLDSQEFNDEALDHAVDYFNFYREAMRTNLVMLKLAMEQAKHYQSENKSTLFRKGATFMRGLKMPKEVNVLFDAITAFLMESPDSRDPKQRVLYTQAYLRLSEEASALSRVDVKSKRMNACFAGYHSGGMFQIKMVVSKDLTDVLLPLLPEDKRDRILILLQGDESVGILRATVNPSAPALDSDLEYAPPQKNKTNPDNSSHVFVPPAAVTSIYPSLSQPQPVTDVPFEGRIAAYKEKCDALYASYCVDNGIDALLSALNERVDELRGNPSVMECLPLLIDEHTTAIGKYPCLIHGNDLRYVNLDEALECLNKDDNMPGVAGKLTQERIKFCQPSEIVLIATMLKLAKRQLDLASTYANVRMAY
jgi:hypothetical protein